MKGLQAKPREPTALAFKAMWILFLSAKAQSIQPCLIRIIDQENGWPVPLVELRTTHQMRFFSDNAGLIALSEPELMDRQVWFDVIGHGYGVPKDGFGFQGVRIRPAPGKTIEIKVMRECIAKRLGRITGGGLFAHSQILGQRLDWTESDVFGCDSVQTATLDERLFWLWGDTVLPGYPLGIFHASAAFTSLHALNQLEPPIAIEFDYIRDNEGKVRSVAQMPGDGPTWLTGLVTLPDKDNRMHLVATYLKIEPPMQVYRAGLCVWNRSTGHFEDLKHLWSRSPSCPERPALPEGHAVLWSDQHGKSWALFGNPLPTLRCPATFEAWQDPCQWQQLEPQTYMVCGSDGTPVRPHSGSIAWSSYRHRWVTIFTQWFGRPSAFGEVWYAEADNPTGPWGKAVKVLTHNNYTFYNPMIHTHMAGHNNRVLLFEGTFSQQFADKPYPVPRYDYNQVLYRLDLDDARLEPARSTIPQDRQPDQ